MTSWTLFARDAELNRIPDIVSNCPVSGQCLCGRKIASDILDTESSRGKHALQPWDHGLGNTKLSVYDF